MNFPALFYNTHCVALLCGHYGLVDITTQVCDQKKKKKRDNGFRKRNHSFQVKWSDEFPWVNYENEKMLYALCVKSPKLYGRMAGSFVSGFTSFQRATLKSHD